MKELTTTIFVEPTPKGRPRLTTVSGHARAYTPKKTVKAESLIISDIRREIVGKGMFESGIPLHLSATFFIQKPKTMTKKYTMPTKRPDLDNYGKLLLDALNGYAFPDDSQVVTVAFRKRFCASGQVPRIELVIREEEE